MNALVRSSCGLGLSVWMASCGAPEAQQPASAPAPAATSAAAACPSTVIASAPAPSVAPTEPAPAAPVPGDFYATVHGLKMHYLRLGKGPTLVLLHPGMATADFEWASALP